MERSLADFNKSHDKTLFVELYNLVERSNDMEAQLLTSFCTSSNSETHNYEIVYFRMAVN